MGDVILYRSGGGGVTGGGSASFSPVRNFSALAENGKITLTWDDPDDVYNGESGYTWGCTRIVRKVGSTPKNETDGTIIVDSVTRNQYKSTGYVDSSVSNGTTYFYAAFPRSTNGEYGKIPALSTATPAASYKTMSVVFDLDITDPASMCTYDDDATNMTSGKSTSATTSWQSFFGYKPCLLMNGSVIAYLNPTDYTKTINGDTLDLDITTYADVMVEFPRRGIKITRIYNSDSHERYKLSMTDDPNADGYQYYAHTRGQLVCNTFYIGAYNGIIYNDKLRSIHGDPTLKTSAETLLYNWRTYAQNNGAGYELMTFYQFQFIQCMYSLQFKNPNSQNQVGYGYTGKSTRSDVLSNGTMDMSGLVYGTTDRSVGVKVFGIENLWGNCDCFIDGLVWARHLNDEYSYRGWWYSGNSNFTAGDPDAYDGGEYNNWSYSTDTRYECEGSYTAQEYDGYFGWIGTSPIFDQRYIFLSSGSLQYLTATYRNNYGFCDTSVGTRGTISNPPDIRKDHPYVGVYPLVSGSSVYTDEVGIFYMDRIESSGADDFVYNENQEYPILLNARISYYQK